MHWMAGRHLRRPASSYSSMRRRATVSRTVRLPNLPATVSAQNVDPLRTESVDRVRTRPWPLACDTPRVIEQ